MLFEKGKLTVMQHVSNEKLFLGCSPENHQKWYGIF
jgi:hypothetical protein